MTAGKDTYFSRCLRLEDFLERVIAILPTKTCSQRLNLWGKMSKLWNYSHNMCFSPVAIVQHMLMMQENKSVTFSLSLSLSLSSPYWGTRGVCHPRCSSYICDNCAWKHCTRHVRDKVVFTKHLWFRFQRNTESLWKSLKLLLQIQRPTCSWGLFIFSCYLSRMDICRTAGMLAGVMCFVAI